MQTSTPSCSIVIHPPAPVQGYVNKCKRELHQALHKTWFHSLNSAAHISFVTFPAAVLQKHLSAIADFCRQTAPLTISLDGFDAFPESGAFYLRPDRPSRAALQPVMKAFRKATAIGAGAYSTEPHISIGRKLDKDQLGVARALFAGASPALRFECRSLWLRRRNEHSRQYELFQEFPLTGSNTHSDRLPQGWQASLF